MSKNKVSGVGCQVSERQKKDGFRFQAHVLRVTRCASISDDFDFFLTRNPQPVTRNNFECYLIKLLLFP